MGKDRLSKSLEPAWSENTYQEKKAQALRYLKQGRRNEAERLFGILCDSPYADASCWYHRGLIYLRSSNPHRGVECLQTALHLNRFFRPALQALAKWFAANSRLKEAENCYRQLVDIDRDQAKYCHGLGVTLLRQKKYVEAIPYLEKAVISKPDYVEALSNLGTAYYNSGEYEKALECFARTLVLHDGFLYAVAGAANVYEKQGRHQQAYAMITPVLERNEIVPLPVALVYANICHKAGDCREAVHYLEHWAERESIPVDEKRQLHFTLARRYDRLGQHEQAFHHARLANELTPVSFNAQQHTRWVDQIIAAFPSARLKTYAHASDRAALPVFIIGMPRSGTSVLEQILSAHPEIHAAGELAGIPHIAASLHQRSGMRGGFPAAIGALTTDTLNDLSEEYLAAVPGLSHAAQRFTDKMPLNFLYLGMIELMFPGAKIIHCRRHPLDTCLSCYLNDFTGALEFSYSLETLASYYVDYRRLMKHWRHTLNSKMIEVDYERLVDAPEAVVRAMLEFVGLEWSPQCLEFYRTGRQTVTASYEQVRQPLYRSSVGRWKNYASQLDGLHRHLNAKGIGY